MNTIDFDAAIRQGVCTEAEASSIRSCIKCDADGVWLVDFAGCDETERNAITRVVHWACSEGPIQ